MGVLSFAGIGTPGIILILVVVLLIFGPTKLPQLAKSVGKSIREFKKASKDVKDDIDEVKKDLTLDDSEEPAKKETTDN